MRSFVKMPDTQPIKKRKFRSLTVTLAIAFLALNAVVLLIANCLNIYFNLKNQQKLIANQQQLIAQNAANAVKGFIQEKFGTLEAAASLGKLAVAHEEEQKTVMEKQLGLEPAFRQLVLFDTQEREILRVSRLSKSLAVQLMEYDKSKLFSEMGKKKPYISTAYIDKITNEPMVIMAVPVTDVFGDFKGILMAETNLKFMWNLMDRIEIGKKGLAYVVDKQGNLIAFRDLGRVLKRENIVHLKEVHEFVMEGELHRGSSANVVEGIEGTKVVANHENLGMPDWAVVVELPVLEAYESVIEGSKLSVIAMLLSLILAILAGAYLSKKITRPIIRLRDATREVGKGDFSGEIAVESKDETGELALSFNQMLADLHKTTVSIKELRKEQKRFEDVVSSTGEWIWEVDSEGRYTYCSPAVERILGYKPEEILGKYFYKLFHPDERNKLKNSAYEIFSRKELFQNLINRNVHKDGRSVILETSGVPILSAENKLLGYRGADRDITERIQAEQKLKQIMDDLFRSNSELEHFAFIASHDLQEPLRMISSYVQLLARRYKDKLDSDAEDFIAFAQDGAVRMQKMINDLLVYSRVGTRGKSFMPTSCEDILDQALKNLQIAIKESHAAITHDPLPTVMADSSQFTQLFQNLIGNALKFRGDKTPKVHISAVGQNREWIFSMQDNGIGIETENLERIFLIFQRLHTRKQYTGTGIGLAVCKKIVERHGGRIWVESKPGKGSKFCFTVPKNDAGQGGLQREMGTSPHA